MNNLIYVTSNKGKILSAITQFEKQGLNLEWFNHDCKEPNINDIEYISLHKVLEAYAIIKKPCFVVDSGFYIDSYPDEPGFPGAFPKRAVVNNGVDQLLIKMKDVNQRDCRFVDCLTYYDGHEIMVFHGVSEGTLAYEKKGTEQVKAKSDLWLVFIPLNHTQTLAEMTDEERDKRSDNRTSAIDKLIEYIKQENKQKKLK